MASDSEQEIEEFEFKVCYIHFHWEDWAFLASVGNQSRRKTTQDLNLAM